MENLHQLLVNRRSIRRYTPQPIDSEHVRMILEAALLSPTSKSSRAWEFVVIEDKQTLDSLSQCKMAGAGPVAKATLAVVVAVDTTSTEPWIEDGSIAASNMMLQAADLGIGSCWIQVRGRGTADGTPSEDFVQDLLGIPEHIIPLCIITLGYADEQRKPQDCEKLLWEKIHIGNWAGQ